jgi:type VI protein secretion system component Hcp
LLSGLQTVGSPGATAEQVSFNFTKITHTHQEQDAKTGAIGDAATTTYDVVQSKTFASTAGASADAIKTLPVGGLPVDVNLDYYVTYEGAGGWLELEGFSVTLSNSTSIGSTSGGAGAGKVKMDGATLALGSSNEIVELMAKMTQGQHLQFLEVEAYRSSGGTGKQLVDEYYFDTVFLNSLDTTDHANVLGITAGKFSHGHVEQSKTGGVGDTFVEGWSFIDNTAWTAPGAPDADLF